MDVEKHGFNYPIEIKEQIFKSIIKILKEGVVMNLQDLLLFANVGEKTFLEMFNDKFKALVTNELVKINVLIKLETIKQLRSNVDASSKKLLLQLTSNNDEYKRISTQWTFVESKDSDEFILPKRRTNESK